MCLPLPSFFLFQRVFAVSIPFPGVPCSGFSSCTLPVMPAAMSKPAESCKFCHKQFGVDRNPTIKNPGASDLLARRAPGSKEFKVCFGFLRSGDSRFSQLTRTALADALKDPAEQSSFDSELNRWCEARRDGKRRRGGLWLGPKQGTPNTYYSIDEYTDT